ncbi:hypothetical protein C8R48DRAFT_351052 [Suillus tomentosus]|nr:hypothetical protein C8R48DRAFT_351052 [Suillus tomentosus]
MMMISPWIIAIVFRVSLCLLVPPSSSTWNSPSPSRAGQPSVGEPTQLVVHVRTSLLAVFYIIFISTTSAGICWLDQCPILGGMSSNEC